MTPLLSSDELEAIFPGMLVDTSGQVGDLTPRQREVLQLVAEGRTAKEVAGTLSISVKTVEFHKARIMERLGLQTTPDLVKYAIAHGITALS